MTVTISSSTPASPTTVVLEYSSTLPTPTFYIYAYGSLIAITAATTYEIEVPAGESVPIEVFDDPDTVPSYARDGHEVLCWASVADTDRYVIEEYFNSVWTQRGIVETSAGRPWYEFKTRLLEDVTDHIHRVTPIGADENLGTPLEFKTLMVRIPDVTAIVTTYDNGTGKVTVAAA